LPTALTSSAAFYGHNVTGEPKRGEKPEVLAASDIIFAWVLTLPAAGVIAAIVFFALGLLTRG
jgi:phosphate/sulfate permease